MEDKKIHIYIYIEQTVFLSPFGFVLEEQKTRTR